mgnify:FL=1
MKTILITGGTDGIGKQTLLNIAKENHHVIFVGRDEKKCQSVSNEIIDITSNENIDFFVSDLSLVSENKLLANKIKEKYQKLDVLLNNVGALFINQEETEEGFEKTFALNHLGVFTLTLELIELLKANNHARIINVASAAHFNVIDSSSNEKTNRTLIESIVFKTSFNINDLQSKNKYKGAQQYSRSKLMNVLFTYKLALEHLKGTNITANCLHPGFVASKFGHNNTGFFKSFLKFGQRVGAVSLEDGSRASTFLALSDKIKDISGKYFDEDCTQIKSSSLSYNKELQDSLWEQSKQLIKLL